jgi:soluble lytic murein transglycosylase-like protein
MKETLQPIVIGTVMILAIATAEKPKENFRAIKTKQQDIADVDYETGCDTAAPPNFDEMIEQVAKEYNINPKMIASTVYRESACDKDATGAQGEIGLGQLHPKVWTKILQNEGIIKTKRDLYDPRINLRATAFVLDRCRIKHKGSPFKTFGCYNGSGLAARRYASEQMKSYKTFWNEEPAT